MMHRVPLLALLLVWHALASGASSFNADEDGVAIGGYDPVAYFTRGRAVPGLESLAVAWRGVTWRFASPAHRDRFLGDPETYAPQFGGYCALAMASGRAVEVDFVDAFTVDGGRLYFNYDRSVRQRWLRGVNRYLRKARARWPETRRKLEASTISVHRRRDMPTH